MGIAQATRQNWKKGYSGLSLSEVPPAQAARGRKRAAEEACRRSGPGQRDAPAGAAKKNLKTARWRELADWLVQAYQVNTRRVTAMLLMSSSSYYYKAHPRDDRAERAPINELAETRLRYGIPRVQILMRRVEFSGADRRLLGLSGSHALVTRDWIPN